jgi:C4-dicarboxylate transporter DctQ subunit
MPSPENLTAPARALAAIDAALARIETAAALLGGGLIAASMALTMVEVLARRLFNAPVPGMIDLFDLVMSGMALLGIGYCQRLGGHIRVEILLNRLGVRARWAMECATTCIAALFIALIATSSIGHAIKAWRVDDVTSEILLPLWPSKALAGAALALLAVRLTVNALGYARLMFAPLATPIGIPTTPAPDQKLETPTL